MARREPVRLPRVRLATAGLPRAAMPAAGWEQARPTKTAGGGGGGGGTGPDPMEAPIMEALVLWYDPRRQGATNASMAADPRLIDLSGNGHDALCRNFAWGGMSGIGGIQLTGTATSADGVFVVPSDSYANTAVSNKIDKEIVAVFEVKGNDGRFLRALNVGGTGGRIDMTTDGIFSLTVSPHSYLTFYTTTAPTEDDVYPGGQIVRFLPLYPGAIVSDGVDDMVTATGLPLLEDFTVVAEREFIRFDQFGAIAFKKDYRGNGAFIFEMSYNKNNATQPDECCVFSNLDGGGNNDITPEAGRVSWMTPASYNGQPLSRGELTDKPELRLFYNGSAVHQNCAAALWSFLLFRRTLSGEEIEWVKKHLMGEPK